MKWTKVLTLLTIIIFTWATSVSAQEKKASKDPAKKSAPAKGGGAEDAEMKAMMEDAKPGTVHAWFAKLADRKSTRLNSSHIQKSRMPSSA